jgi:hypothetical protein
MRSQSFPGQQTDEKILYYAKPHNAIKYISFVKILIGGLLVLLAFQIISLNLPFYADTFGVMGYFLTIFLIIIGLWWVKTTHDSTEIYITDRRIVKFSAFSPLHKTTRTLYWDEAVKSKTYRKNHLLEKMLGIGSLEIHARSQDKDNVDIDHLIYHEDLANYIDKILYTFKNKPEDLKTFREFVPKPKGQRG